MNDSIKTILYIIFYFGVGILLGYIIGEYFLDINANQVWDKIEPISMFEFTYLGLIFMAIGPRLKWIKSDIKNKLSLAILLIISLLFSFFIVRNFDTNYLLICL